MKKITLLMLFPLFSYSQWIQVGQDIDGEAANDISGWATDISGDGDIVAIGALNNENSSGNGDAGHVRIYENTGSVWSQIGGDIDGVSASDRFGIALSLSDGGNVIAIGGKFYGHEGEFNVGHVRIFENISGSWIQIGDDIIGEAEHDESGGSVSLNNDGSIVAIGSEYNNMHRGHVRVFQNTGGAWVQLGMAIQGEAIGDQSGVAVSLNNDGTIIAIGAGNNDGVAYDTGHVRVFEFVSGSWQQIGGDIEGEGLLDKSGSALSLNGTGNIVAIGAGGNDNSNGIDAGHVRVYENLSGVWTQMGNDIDGETEGDYCGNSVSLNNSGDIVAIGSFRNGTTADNSGHVRIFKYESGDWVQVSDNIDGEAVNDQSGKSVSLNNDGSVVIIGAWQNDGINGENSGHARVYSNALLSIEDSNFAEVIKVYPNPSYGVSTIQLGAIHQNIDLQIFDALGKMIESKAYSETDFIQLNFQNYSKGVYFIKISSNKKSASLKLLIKN